MVILVSKRISEVKKKQILESFEKGLKIKDISEQFDISIPTINKHLKNILGDEQFKKIKENFNQKFSQIKEEQTFENDRKFKDTKSSINKNFEQEEFFEILPLEENFQFNNQKELASLPIINFDFPDNVFMVVTKFIEIEPKRLADYPSWSFLPIEDLERKTIEIYSNINSAKNACNKNEKVIKVPNPKVFSIAARILKSKGISRIIFEDSLLSL